MLQAGKTLKTAALTDIEALAEGFSELREEFAKLSESVAASAQRRGRRMASEISDGVGDAIHYAERRGKDAEEEIGKTVANHPLLVLGLAAGLGLIIGAMSRR